MPNHARVCMARPFSSRSPPCSLPTYSSDPIALLEEPLHGRGQTSPSVFSFGGGLHDTWVRPSARHGGVSTGADGSADGPADVERRRGASVRNWSAFGTLPKELPRAPPDHRDAVAPMGSPWRSAAAQG